MRRPIGLELTVLLTKILVRNLLMDSLGFVLRYTQFHLIW